MSTAIQDRLQMSRALLDKWSKREQLCLASAVSCSGDQNWITVSRTLRAVCGNGNETRPADWYSQKNCAVQYGHLLESVETTKRKKRSSEGGAGVSSPAPVEPPTELLLRRLTEERLAEIKTQMRQSQEEYLKVFQQIEALQSDELSEQELQEMWQEIENQQETQRIAEMKLENRMREREQRKKEMASTWRSATGNKRTISTTDTTAVDMDVEEINIAGTKGQQPTGTSPLLTSLLKSPTSSSSSSTTATTTANSNTTTLINPSTSTGTGTGSGSGSVARATAPTITTLLTSGAGAIPNQPVLTIKSGNDSSFINRPISGPPADDGALTPTTPGTGRSPSQSAPTLSMLLEKNKLPVTGTGASSTSTTASTAMNENIIKQEDNLESTKSDENTPNDNPDSDETEEQQLLEVFKNMDDIMDDIDIEMANVIDEDILKDVGDEVNSPTNPSKTGETETKKEEKESETISQETTNNKEAEIEDEEEAAEPKVGATEKVAVETVTGSSDDSNDNIPLAAVVTQDNIKERNQSSTEGNNTLSINSDENLTPTLTSEVAVEEIPTTSAEAETNEEPTLESSTEQVTDEQKATTTTTTTTDETQNANETTTSEETIKNEDTAETSALADESMEALTVEESSTEEGSVTTTTTTTTTKTKTAAATATTNTTTNPKEEDASTKDELTTETTNQTTEKESEKGVQAPSSVAVISIHDTDEELSSLTDSSKTDEPLRSSKPKQQQQQQPRKSTNDEPKIELESSVVGASATATTPQPQPPSCAAAAGTRAPLLRKLPHRDRSESPMIDDDQATASDHSTATTTTTARTNLRRRCSSTPLIDSIPNSPASSEPTDDRRETRGASKKHFLGIYNTMCDSKHATIFRRAFTDEHTDAALCLRAMDLPTIKRNIDAGNVRTINELHRDVLLMCNNILLIYKPHTAQHKTALLFMQDCHAIKEFAGVQTDATNNNNNTTGTGTSVPNTTTTTTSSSSNSTNIGKLEREREKSTGNKGRSGSRKSQRHH